MANIQDLLQRLRIAVVIIFALTIELCFLNNNVFATKKNDQVDIIYIDTMKNMKKKLEMPPVVFFHDQHTQALSGQDCNICHDLNDKEHPFAFLAFKEAKTSQELQDAFHKMCIGCHLEYKNKDLSSGPLIGECRECHISDFKYDSVNTRSLTQSKFFHFIHVNSPKLKALDSKENCGVCHHIYDPKQRMLVWKKGVEDACSVCHNECAEGNKPSLKTASHNKCIGCHLNFAEKAKITGEVFRGPVVCEECHAKQVKIDTSIKKIPRLMRDQPDVTVILPVEERDRDTTNFVDSGMKPVLFNHKAHEAVVNDCRSCHHLGQVGTCTQCHTVEGKERGNFVNLAEAMHSKTSEQSCVGCHQKRLMEKKECAGCHILLKPMLRDSCGTCHVDIQGISLKQIADGSAFKLKREELYSIAQKNLDMKKRPVQPLSPSEIPETVTISILSNEYEPSVMPHRKIYENLVTGIEKSGLAEAFHTTPTVICAACHHRSPKAELLTPPKCFDCHSAQADKMPVDENKPSLKVAFHQQCMACHEQMQVKPISTDCAGCHISKN